MAKYKYQPFRETVMTIKNRAQTGKFAAKSETPRKVRSVNLTDAAWQWLARTAEEAGLSRNDWIEAIAGQQPIMETAQSSTQPIMETAQSSTQPIMETAQSSTQPIMEAVMANAEPVREMVVEVERLHQALFATDNLLIAKNAAIAKLESELSTIRQEKFEANLEIDRLESELANRSAQTSALVGTDLSKVEAADLLNQLKARRKKSRADLADMEAVLDVLAELGD
jgi:chromosome segregation ATPase